MKARYLGERHPGHGVTFATGTPVSNSMVELFTLQRFLDPAGLRDRGLDHFDAWAATFGKVVDTLEIAPDGATLRPRSRFARFTNLPELQHLFRAFADVRTADDLDLPRPALAGGKPHVVACPMSAEQCEEQGRLVDRYETLRSRRVDPREDNALAVTTDGRKLALDARMLAATAGDFPGSKINAIVDNVVRVWDRTTPVRGTQMVFCDLGVAPTPWGFSVYDEVIAKLVARGIPRGQIAAVGEADSDARKQALFDQVRAGTVRVLLGSTQKMGAGTNVQKRLVALHHLDAPWKPAEVEQREGRILRQGNENVEVEIYRYVTEGSFDAYMWQALETKARFIAQVMTGRSAVRRADDVGGQELSYAEVKAIASGNPAVLTLAEADAEVQRLSVMRKAHADEQFLARRHLRELPGIIDRLHHRQADLAADRDTVTAREHDPLVLGGRKYHRDAVPALGKLLGQIPSDAPRTRRFPLGEYRGLKFGLERHPGGATDVYLDGRASRLAMLSSETAGPRAVLNALARVAASYDAAIDKCRDDLDLAERQQHDYQARSGRPFDEADYLSDLTGLRDQLRSALSAGDPTAEPAGGPSSTALAEAIKTLTAGQSVDEPSVRSDRPAPSAGEEPVTARIRRRAGIGTTRREPAPAEDSSFGDRIDRPCPGAERGPGGGG